MTAGQLLSNAVIFCALLNVTGRRESQKRWMLVFRVTGLKGKEKQGRVGRIGVYFPGGWYSDQTIRMSRRRRKIGAKAAGLRARQDYLPSGGKQPSFV